VGIREFSGIIFEGEKNILSERKDARGKFINECYGLYEG
jgi:hypothetical protein